MIKVEGRKYKLPYRNSIQPQTTCFIIVGNSSSSDWLATAVLFCRIVYRVFCGTCLTQKLLAPTPSKWALSENQTKLNQRNPNQLKVTHPTPRKTNHIYTYPKKQTMNPLVSSSFICQFPEFPYEATTTRPEYSWKAWLALCWFAWSVGSKSSWPHAVSNTHIQLYIRSYWLCICSVYIYIYTTDISL